MDGIFGLSTGEFYLGLIITAFTLPMIPVLIALAVVSVKRTLPKKQLSEMPRERAERILVDAVQYQAAALARNGDSRVTRFGTEGVNFLHTGSELFWRKECEPGKACFGFIYVSGGYSEEEESSERRFRVDLTCFEGRVTKAVVVDLHDDSTRTLGGDELVILAGLYPAAATLRSQLVALVKKHSGEPHLLI